MNGIPTTTPKELSEKPSDEVLILDVREQNEFDFASVEGSKHIPMIQVPARLNELEKNQEIAVLCLGGGRSGRITGFLLQQGFTNVKNIAGGIRRWSDEVDPNVPKYRIQNGQVIPS